MDLLFAFEGSGQQGGLMAQLMPFILILFIVYFLMIRPQMKRQKEKQNMLKSLQKGDKVVTIGGIHGTVVGVKQKGAILVLKLDRNMDITINRSAIAGLEKNVSSDEITAIDGKS